MPRSAVAPAVVGLCALLLAFVGCQSRSSSTPENSGGLVPASKTSPESSKLFADWPTPLGAILISGEMHGYDEPCGCTAGQKGGLARRFDLIDRLRKQGWQLAKLDLGGLMNDPNSRTRGGPEETKVRFETSLLALDMMGYSAVALAATDLKPTIIDSIGLFMQMDKGRGPIILCANVTTGQGLDLGDRLKSRLRVKAGSKTLGVTAVLDVAELDKLSDSKDGLLVSQPAEDVVPGVLADLEKDSDVQILMVQGSPEVARRLAIANPGFEIVVATSPNTDPDKDPTLLNDGKTMLVQVGHKGQYVGVLGLFDDAKSPIRYQRVQLGDRLNAKFEDMRHLIDEEMQERFRQADVLDKFPRLPLSATGAPDGSAYVGAETCKSCHPNTFKKWSSTKHALAYEDLVKDPHDPRRNRESDAACVVCHTTGFEYEGGFRSAAATPHLRGNQCENCHGPGSKHAEAPDNADFRLVVRRSAPEFDKNHRCTQCHDEDNAPHGFDFAAKWDEIAHKGLDNYDDAAVHKGISRSAGVK